VKNFWGYYWPSGVVFGALFFVVRILVRIFEPQDMRQSALYIAGHAILVSALWAGYMSWQWGPPVTRLNLTEADNAPEGSTPRG